VKSIGLVVETRFLQPLHIGHPLLPGFPPDMSDVPHAPDKMPPSDVPNKANRHLSARHIAGSDLAYSNALASMWMS
jgi:hypothetical protein